MKTRLLMRRMLIAAPLLLALLACSFSDPAASSPTPRPTVAPSVHEVANTLYYHDGAPDFISAPCPPGEFVLGGGWSTPETEVKITAALVVQNAWTVYVSFPATTSTPPPAYTVVAHAECLRGVGGATIVQRQFRWEVPGQKFGYTLPDPCNADEIRVGSGFDVRGTTVASAVAIVGNETTGGQGDRWIFTVNNYAETPQSILTMVECLSHVTAPTAAGALALNLTVSSSYPTSTSSQAGDNSAVSTVACPSSAVLAGGGLSETVCKPVSGGQRRQVC
jgi:hypothetical protein